MNRPVDLPLSVSDTDLNTSDNPSFNAVLDARLSRRSILRGGVGTASSMLLGGWSLAACGGSDDPVAAPAPAAQPVTTLSFAPVAKSLADAVSVPVGYTASIIYALGDPLDAATPAYLNDGSDADFDKRAGDHHDGMEYFGLSADGTARDANGSERGLLAINHEATSNRDVRSYFLHGNGGTLNPRPPAEADKEVAVHGISIVEVRRTGGQWATVRDSAYNRRITPLTQVRLPALRAAMRC